MSIFIGFFGQYTAEIMDFAEKKICVSKFGKNTHFSKFFIHQNCTLASIIINKGNLTDSNYLKIDHTQHKHNLPIYLQCQMPVSAFIKSNSALIMGNKFELQQCNDEYFARFTQSMQDLIQNELKQQQNILHNALNRITGHFRMCIFSESAQSLLLATSAFNPETLFYAQLKEFPDTYVVSNSLTCLLQIQSPKVNQNALALWLSGRPNPNLSLYSNIKQVPQANYVILNRKKPPSAHQYWNIEPQTDASVVDVSNNFTSTNKQNNSKNLEIQQQTLSTILKNSVKSHVITNNDDKPIFTQLSGGMDSTTVSALAHTLLKNANKRLHSISHTYRNTHSCDEMDNIQSMTSTFAFAENHFIELDKYTHMSFRELYPTHAQSPGMVLSPKYYEEAQLMKQNGASILLTGNGGDEMFWGHSLAYYDRLKKGDTKVIKEVAKSAKQLGLPVLKTLRTVFASPFIKYDLKPFLRMADRFTQLNSPDYFPPWLTEKSRTLITQENTFKNPFANPGNELSKCARYEGVFNTSTFNSMRSYQAVFDEFNLQHQTDLQVRHPLFTKEIAAFSFEVDQHLHISGHYPKLLLRQTMGEILPKQVCWNQQKTVFDQHFAKLISENVSSLRLLLSHTALQDIGLLDNEKLLHAFDKVVNSKTPSLNVDLLYAILVQSWYQTHIES